MDASIPINLLAAHYCRFHHIRSVGRGSIN